MSEPLPVAFYWVVVWADVSIKAIFPWDEREAAEAYAKKQEDCLVHPGVIQGAVTYQRD